MWELKDFAQIKRWTACHLIIGVTFFLASLIINAVQGLLYCTLRPFNKKLYTNINYYLLYSIMSQILFLCDWWSGSEVRVHSDAASHELFGKEHCLIIMNHTYEVDWLMGWMVADHSKCLGGAKVFVKKMMQYVPTIGWAWRFSDIIFLSRNWQEDKTVMESQVQEFYNYPYPIWMLLFAEGTRFTQPKHEASMQFAKERGLPQLKRHLIPRTRGFIQCAQSLKGHFPAIYDVTVGFNTKEGADPTILSMLRGEKVVGDMYIRRLPLSDVPTGSDEETAKYLHELYQTKDKLLDSYINTGSFSEESGMESFTPVVLERSYKTLMNVVLWVSFMMYWSVRLLYNASLPLQCSAAAFMVLAYVGLHKLIGLTKITKGSQYGSNSPTAAPSNGDDKKHQ